MNSNAGAVVMDWRRPASAEVRASRLSVSEFRKEVCQSSIIGKPWSWFSNNKPLTTDSGTIGIFIENPNSRACLEYSLGKLARITVENSIVKPIQVASQVRHNSCEKPSGARPIS